MADAGKTRRKPIKVPEPQKDQPDPRWVRTGWGHEAANQDELLRAIHRIGSLESGRRYVWRGARDARWRLRPSLVRHLVSKNGLILPTEKLLRDRERAILREARAWRLGLSAMGFIPDLQLLANLQHHGVHTRLLDVTTNPMTALWLACQAVPDKRDAAGVLFAFDVTSVPTQETMTIGTTSWNELTDPAGGALESAIARSASDQQPFLVIPTQRDERMQAQEGLFIAGATQDAPGQPTGLEGFPLDAKEPPGKEKLAALFAPEERTAGRPSALPFCALIVPPRIKRSVVPHLEGTFNRRESTLFPDLDGYAQALRDSRVNLTMSVEPGQPDSGG